MKTETAGSLPANPHFSRNATLLSVSTLTFMSGATISASLPGIAARFSGVPNVEPLREARAEGGRS